MSTEATYGGTLEEIVGGAEVERVASGFQFTEGPVWVPDGYLLFSDIPANTIYKWAPGAEGVEVFRRPSGHANGLTLDRAGRLVACEHDRRLTRTEPDGSITTLAESYQGKRLNSPNDVVVRSDGSIYLTDPPYGLPNQGEGRELPYNGVFRLAPDGTLTLLDDSFERPNGLAFSPDERVLYVDDTSRGHIRAFDVGADGTLSNGRVFAELKRPGADGAPDGMKVDLHGNVYCTGPGGIWVVAPSGSVLGVIEIPEAPANLAWGDADLKTLYVTARTGLYRIRLTTGGAPLVAG
ncbi:MAG: SMP-30/gluconolactonase/LRE family protein [Anaerolineae bacterium]|nr:SMP-30/gluconolactonase/LRE family protein [Anaerolineae bacterium]